MWEVSGLGGVFVVFTQLLSANDVREVAITRGGPIMVFLVAITMLAELADRAGVFDAAAVVCARAARGSTPRLFLLIAALGTLTTIVMSLDTTAVLLTPVVLALTARLALAPLPFALLTVWLANTASLLLPVSNLTNLLAVQRLDLSTIAFAAHMALPELVAVTVTVAYLGLLYHRDLSGRYDLPESVPPADAVLFWVCAAACVALAPLVLLGIPPWAAATPCAATCLAAFAVRQRTHLTWSLLPWRIVIFAESLFLLITALDRHGGTRLLEHLIGHSTLATTAVAGAASNVVNNLPAYLAIETTVPPGHTTQLLSALLGANAGPLILVWGSLATLLWRDRCRARGLVVPPARFALVGVGGVPLVLLGTWAALALTG
jgi:arsenical pump membrane protein